MRANPDEGERDLRTTFRKGMSRAKHAVSRLRISLTHALPSALDMTDEQFLKLFAIRDAPDRLTRTPEIAIGELLGHFERRPAASWPSFPRHMTAEALPAAADVERAADRVLDRYINLGSFGEIHFETEIDWHHAPTNDPRGEATRKLNRHFWWMPVAEAYRVTGNDRYAEFLDRAVRDWVASAPRPPSKDESSRTWALMEAGIRCLIWPTVFGVIQDSPAFTSEARLAMLRSLFDHGVYLQRHHNTGNHLLREANGLAHLSTAFPEFDTSEGWWETAATRLHGALEEQVNADGSHYELCTPYQVLALEEFAYAVELFRGQNDHRSQFMTGRLAAMFGALAALTRPDGSLPMIGDGYFPAGFDWGEMLSEAATNLNDPSLAFIATGGRDGTAPAADSVAVPDAGWYVMRDTWRATGKYLLFESGPFGGHHGHEDKLNVEVFALGTAFLVDPGTYTYNINDPERDFFVSSRAHNTLVVTGLSQVRRWNPKHRRARVASGPHGTWQTGSVFDFASADYEDGYGDYHLRAGDRSIIAQGVVHHRHVLFVKPDYWIIVDDVSSLHPRSFEILFHAGIDVRATSGPRQLTRLASPRGDAMLAIIPEPTECEGPEIVRGRTDPLQGWVSERRYDKQPADTVVYRWSERRALHHTTMLWPTVASLDAPLPDLERVTDEGPTTIWRVSLPDGTSDSISLTRDSEGVVGAVAVDRHTATGKRRTSRHWTKEPY